jgi:Vacuolar protein sorting-associated protein 26.
MLRNVFDIFYVIYCRYHLKDVIVGKIYFLLVRIKIKNMEIAIIKRETTGSGWF